MKPAPFAYHAPPNLSEALALMAELDDVRPLAGGQSLMPMMNFRFVQPKALVDLNGIESLQGIKRSERSLVFGAMTRQREMMQSAIVAELMPIMPVALAHVGHRQTRARGTIGGSLAHFDPAAELANLACLYDCELTLEREDGSRRIGFDDYARGYMTTAIEPDELLTVIEFPIWSARYGFSFQEFALRRGDFAIAAASCLIATDSGGRIERAAIAVSGVSSVPQRLRQVEAALIGQIPARSFGREAGAAAAKLEAVADAYVSAEYRAHLASVMTRLAVDEALATIPAEEFA